MTGWVTVGSLSYFASAGLNEAPGLVSKRSMGFIAPDPV